MMVVWLAAGIIGVSLAFLLPSHALNPWDPLNAAGLAALAYLASLMAVTTRRPFPRRAKGLAWTVFLVVGTAIAFSWTGLERQVHFLTRGTQSEQADLLLNEEVHQLLDTLKVRTLVLV